MSRLSSRRLFTPVWHFPTWLTLARLIPVCLIATHLSLLAGCGTEGPTQAPGRAAVIKDDPAIVTASDADRAHHKVVPGSYIVTFRNNVSGHENGLYFSSFAEEFQAHFAVLSDQYLADPRLKDINYLTSVDLAKPMPSAWRPSLKAPPLQLAWSQESLDPAVGVIARVDFTDEKSARSALAEWNNDGQIWFAEPNYISHLDDNGGLFQNYANTYQNLQNNTDTYWWLDAIHLTEAFNALAQRDQTKTASDQQINSSPPIIAVLDSGVDYQHPALKSHIFVNPEPGISGCGNDIHGCNVTAATKGSLGNPEVWPIDTNGPGSPCNGKIKDCPHGTTVASVIAGDATWSDGSHNASGICPMCQILIVKVVEASKDGSGIQDSAIISGMKYVSLFRSSQSGSAVRVLNCSFGRYARSKAIGVLVRSLRDSGNGALVVAAAGNEDSMLMSYPAAFSDAIAVAAVDANKSKSFFSDFGRWVDIAAPGRDIQMAAPGGRMMPDSGTSMAAPFVAAVAGLVVAEHPNISFTDLRNTILQSADPSIYDESVGNGLNYNYYYPKIPGEPLRQPLLGYGLLDAAAAVTGVNPKQPIFYNALDRVDPNRCGVVSSGTGSKGAAAGLLALLAPVALILLSIRGKRQRS